MVERQRSSGSRTGIYFSADADKSIRACAGTNSCAWDWKHTTTDNDSQKTNLWSELMFYKSYLPESQFMLLAATLNKCMDVASAGKFKFCADLSKTEQLRNEGVDDAIKIGPVRKMRRTKAVFEISQTGRDWEGEGMDGYRYFRLYFSEPPLDNGELVSLQFDSKPQSGSDIQNQHADEAQRRYDKWMKSQT